MEVLRILLSIGGTEICHFQTRHDKAGNAIASTATVIYPVTRVPVFFPDLTQPSVGEDLKNNLIMPEPTVFLSRQLPHCSIIRPTETKGAAMAALSSFIGDGLFSGQSFQFMRDLTEDADEARRIL